MQHARCVDEHVHPSAALLADPAGGGRHPVIGVVRRLQVQRADELPPARSAAPRTRQARAMRDHDSDRVDMSLFLVVRGSFFC